jgi:gamma-glutamyl-gamma-aminobutyrate hydrolase PuuD
MTMRSTRIEGRDESRDCLQDTWWPLLELVGVAPLMLPNHLGSARSILRSSDVIGLLLTGGDSISAITGLATERDRVEEMAIEESLHRGLPSVGVCRGMQKLVTLFGGEVSPVSGHAGSVHGILGPGVKRRVNTFHDYGCIRIPQGFSVRAHSSDDGLPEWVENLDLKVTGVMWHPERGGAGPAQEDILLLRNAFFRR